MNYSLKEMTADELKELLVIYSEATLCKPISKNPEYFKKYTKGFRTTNLPKNILYKIYYDEIHSRTENPLEIFLIENLKSNFENTKIEEIVDKISKDNILLVASDIEQEIQHSKLTISPKQVFLVAGFKVGLQEGKVMDAYHSFFLDESKRIQDDCTDKLVHEHNVKYTKLQNSYYDKASLLTIERNAVKDLSKVIEQKDAEIDALNFEKLVLKEKLQREIKENELLKIKIRDFDLKENQLSKQKNEIIVLSKQLEELRIALDKAEERVLSPEKVQELSLDVLEDLKTNDIAEEIFLQEANSFFSSDEKLIDSWSKLSSFEMEKLNLIVDKMERNLVENEEMDILDFIENMIYYKYMIVKGLKTIFYRYLEQKLEERSINQRFYKC